MDYAPITAQTRINSVAVVSFFVIGLAMLIVFIYRITQNFVPKPAAPTGDATMRATAGDNGPRATLATTPQRGVQTVAFVTERKELPPGYVRVEPINWYGRAPTVDNLTMEIRSRPVTFPDTVEGLAPRTTPPTRDLSLL